MVVSGSIPEWLNNLTNAIKFSETGCITLRAIPQERTSEWILVRFEVQDCGISMLPENTAARASAWR